MWSQLGPYIRNRVYLEPSVGHTSWMLGEVTFYLTDLRMSTLNSYLAQKRISPLTQKLARLAERAFPFVLAVMCRFWRDILAVI